VDLGGHPLTVDDELIARTTEAQLRDLLMLHALVADRQLDDGVWLND
jgi:hypothetical protein